jgi:CO/xanthine dehydrogenase FAD-binding subunit
MLRFAQHDRTRFFITLLVPGPCFMRAYVPEYDLIAPPHLDEALRILAREPGVWRPMAGGTDLMVLFEAGKLADRRLMSIAGLPELKGIEVDSKALTIGAATTYTDVRRHPVLQSEFPLLPQAASWTGSIANQNRGTLGGNIVNASPAADSPPALLVYDAELELISDGKSRWVPYRDFHTGYKTMLLRPVELLARIRLPRHPGGPSRLLHYGRKVGTRNAQAIAKVCLAATTAFDGERITRVRIALGSVAPTPIRCGRTEALLENRLPDAETFAAAKAEIMAEIRPIDDFRSTAAYRRQVAGNLLEEFLRSLNQQGKDGYAT